MRLIQFYVDDAIDYGYLQTAHVVGKYVAVGNVVAFSAQTLYFARKTVRRVAARKGVETRLNVLQDGLRARLVQRISVQRIGKVVAEPRKRGQSVEIAQIFFLVSDSRTAEFVVARRNF